MASGSVSCQINNDALWIVRTYVVGFYSNTYIYNNPVPIMTNSIVSLVRCCRVKTRVYLFLHTRTQRALLI